MEISVWSLWLPILVSGIALFFASFSAWMILPHHQGEWTGLPDEAAMAKAIKSSNIPPGQYMIPFAGSGAEMKSESYRQRVASGPNGTLTLWAGPPSMGRNMACTVLFFIVANFVIAYLATMALDRGEPFMRVFQFVGTAGILTYGTANILNGIWFGRKMIADIVDGVAYGLITGLIFALMWPGAAT
jgi:hypothetical protein